MLQKNFAWLRCMKKNAKEGKEERNLKMVFASMKILEYWFSQDF